MPINSGNAASAVVLITDTTLLNPTPGRAVITSLVLSQTTGAAETIDLFLSSDSSSATAERIERVVLASNETVDPTSMANFAIPEGYYLIAKGTTGSIVTAFLTYTQYSGSS
jgi:hypothetical protein